MKWYHVGFVIPSSGFESRTHLQRPKQVYKLLLTYCFYYIFISHCFCSIFLENIMELVEIWNSLDYVDGFMFSMWLAIMYYVKSWIDHRFNK